MTTIFDMPHKALRHKRNKNPYRELNAEILRKMIIITVLPDGKRITKQDPMAKRELQRRAKRRMKK